MAMTEDTKLKFANDLKRIDRKSGILDYLPKEECAKEERRCDKNISHSTITSKAKEFLKDRDFREDRDFT